MTIRNFQFGEWEAIPSRNILVKATEGEEHHLEPKTMDVLTELAKHSGEVVSREHFQKTVWDGRLIVDEGLTRCISDLRRVMGDNARNPKFIQTLSKRGYRFLIPVIYSIEADLPKASGLRKPRKRLNIIWALGSIIGVLVLLAAYLMVSKIQSGGGEIQIEISSPQELQDVISTKPFDRLKAKWDPKQGAGAIYTVNIKRLDSGAKSSISWSLETANDRLIDSVLPFATEGERYQAGSNVVSTLKLLSDKQIDPSIVELPNHLRQTYQQAQHLTMKGDKSELEESLKKFDLILNENPCFVEAIIGKSTVLRGLGVYVEPQNRAKFINLDALLMQRLAMIQPQNPYLIARSYRQLPGQENWGEYESVLRAVVKSTPSCFECVRRLANYYLKVGWRKRAIDLHEEHLSYYPLSAMAHSELAMIYSRAGNIQGVRKHTDVVRLMGNKRWSLAAETNLHYMLGNSQEWLTHSEEMNDALGLDGPIRSWAAAVVAGDYQRLGTLFKNAEKLNFNHAVALKKFDPLIMRIQNNIARGEYDDLSLIHGWHHTRNDLTASYIDGLHELQNHPQIVKIFKDVGLIEFWNKRKQWPDECSLFEVPLYCDWQVKENTTKI